MACCKNILVVQGETLVWHTGLPTEGEPRNSPPFSYGGREWCFRFKHHDDDGYYHCIDLHRLDADGKIEEGDEVLTDAFLVRAHMLHLIEDDKVVGNVEDHLICETPQWLLWYGNNSEAIFEGLDWLHDRPEVKFACRFPTPPTIPAVPGDDAETEESQSLVKEGMEELQSSLRTLYQSGENCDVILKVGGKEFPVHSLILQTRSPVFHAMFQHNMLEKQRNTVDIEDCDPDTFPAFLEHVYTGGVGMISDCNVFHLFAAADKYDLKTLRRACAEFLKKNLSVASFCRTVALSVKYGERELTELATEYFCDHALDIVQTPEWQIFLAENPTVGNELYIRQLKKGCFRCIGSQ